LSIIIAILINPLANFIVTFKPLTIFKALIPLLLTFTPLFIASPSFALNDIKASRLLFDL
jgi:hypothetical protein